MSEKYRSIAYELESELRQMRLQGSLRLPTEEYLCRKFSCSRHTIRAALDLLVKKGLIEKKRGSGSFIRDDNTATDNRVILIVEDEDEYIYPEFISSFAASLKKKGYDLHCLSTGGSYEGEKDALSDVLELSPSAVIIEPISNIIPDRNMPLIEDIRSKGIPVVYLYTSYPSPSDAVCISEDNAGGSARAVSYLKENGHIFISGIFRCDDSRGLERYKGYTDALTEQGLPFDQKRAFFFTGNDRKRILAGDDSFLNGVVRQMGTEVTAVICHNDEIAYRLRKALSKEGRTEVSVVSFDNSYYASGSAAISSLGHSSRDLITAASDAVISAAGHRDFTPKPVSWHLHTRNG